MGIRTHAEHICIAILIKIQPINEQRYCHKLWQNGACLVKPNAHFISRALYTNHLPAIR